MATNIRKLRLSILYIFENIRSKIRPRKAPLIIVLLLMTIWTLTSKWRGGKPGFKPWHILDLDLNADDRISLQEFIEFHGIRDPVPSGLEDFVKSTVRVDQSKITLEEFLRAGFSGGFGRRSEKLYFEKIAPAYFQRADKNKDGHILTREWIHLMKELRESVSKIDDTQVLLDIFNTTDLTRDGYLNHKDFEPKRMMRAMDSLDWDQKVSFIEFLSSRLKPIRMHDKSVVVDDCDEKFKMADSNHDGFLSEKEFETLINFERKFILPFITGGEEGVK